MCVRTVGTVRTGKTAFTKMANAQLDIVNNDKSYWFYVYFGTYTFIYIQMLNMKNHSLMCTSVMDKSCKLGALKKKDH